MRIASLSFIISTLLLLKSLSIVAHADTNSNNNDGYSFSGPLHKIELDRPDDSSLVVHQGAIQIENGITRTWNNHGNFIDLPETQVRIGLTNRMEGRFLIPDYYAGNANSQIHSGITDSGAGLKIRLVPKPNSQFDLSAIAMLGFPTGTHGLSSHALVPSLRFPWSYNLNGPWGLSGRASFFFPTLITGSTQSLRLRFRLTDRLENKQTFLLNTNRTILHLAGLGHISP